MGRYLLRNMIPVSAIYPILLVGTIGMFVTIFLTMCILVLFILKMKALRSILVIGSFLLYS